MCLHGKKEEGKSRNCSQGTCSFLWTMKKQEVKPWRGSKRNGMQGDLVHIMVGALLSDASPGAGRSHDPHVMWMGPMPQWNHSMLYKPEIHSHQESRWPSVNKNASIHWQLERIKQLCNKENPNFKPEVRGYSLQHESWRWLQLFEMLRWGSPDPRVPCSLLGLHPLHHWHLVEVESTKNRTNQHSH